LRLCCNWHSALMPNLSFFSRQEQLMKLGMPSPFPPFLFFPFTTRKRRPRRVTGFFSLRRRSRGTYAAPLLPYWATPRDAHLRRSSQRTKVPSFNFSLFTIANCVDGGARRPINPLLPFFYAADQGGQRPSLDHGRLGTPGREPFLFQVRVKEKGGAPSPGPRRRPRSQR